MFDDIGLKWGLGKCAAVNIKRGKIGQEQTQMPISHTEFIPLLQNSDHYKFLGKQENATHLEEIVTREASKEYTYLQNKRMRRCGVAPPPPIILERLKLPQQIIYRRKENLSESPNHQKYWENILVSRFYEQFSRNRRNLGHFRKFEKISNS